MRCIPFACQDWQAHKSCPSIPLERKGGRGKDPGWALPLQARTIRSTGSAPVLILHDTTEFIYRRGKSEAIGIVHKQQIRYDSRPRRYHTTYGVLMHSSLVVTQDGLPLGRLPSSSGPETSSMAQTRSTRRALSC